jgi:hypothetical protein
MSMNWLIPEFAAVDVWDNYFWQNDGSMHRLTSTENDEWNVRRPYSNNC